MESKFCLGIIGRCLAFQPWMAISELYHRKLKQMLFERENIHLQTSIAGNSTLSPVCRLQTLSQKKPLDGVLYHMRHFNHSHSLLVRRGYKFSLNPLLTSKEYKCSNAVHFPLSTRKSNSFLSSFDEELTEQKKKSFPKNSLGLINLLAGKLCGLNKISIKQEWIFFENLRKLCITLNIPLFVLGPIPQVKMITNHKKKTRFQKMHNLTHSKLTNYDIPYYLPFSMYDSFGDPLHKKDEVHLRETGHTFLANELYPIITPWIKSILRIQ